ncbi:hypothetical protein [Algoriphagus halophytocola]|uniref:GNAT family N-acetyltransferase n=1 Tax=Algoriphagus halophytocola TaxID=2991499 RepID=A0ABY6MGN5_9BACT|nr:hypothetical protein [Algoriphagus sp. TR-M5]UZD22970.1 hypothetical protein OM944_00445 [Algoriphagus sp. TR-M5]
MSDDTIKDLLRKLNSGKGKNIVYRNSIGGNVEIAKVWIWKKGEYICKNQDFFLVKNYEEKYVAAISGKNNFHWYTLYEERGKGYLSNALRNFVIPFLWGIDRHPIEEPFKISISHGIGPRNFDSSLALAKSVGFKVVTKNDYKKNLSLHYDDFVNKDLDTPKLIPNPNPEAKNQLIKKAQLVEDLVLQIKGELEIMFGENKLEDLRCMDYFKVRLENIFEDYEYKLSN